MKMKTAYWIKKKGYTVVFMAKELGVSRSAFNKWDNGEVEPGFWKIYNLSKRLGVSIEDLIDKE